VTAVATVPEHFPFAMRPASEGDAPFIVDSWMLSYRPSAVARDAGGAYIRGQKAKIRRLLSRANILVACLPEDPETILGWSATEATVVHFVYVKREFRRLGIASSLLSPFLGEATTYTHRTPCVSSFIPSHWNYDPYRSNHE
jgi:hypothetical protein